MDALQFASDELRNDEQVVMTAVKNHHDSFQFASEALRGNVGFKLKWVQEVSAEL